MGLQCAWLDRTWEVDPSKIHGIDNMSFKYGIDEETGAWKKQELTISYTAYKAAGLDVEFESAVWFWYIGQVGQLYIGFNPALAPMKLIDVDVSDVKVMTDGGWMESAKISLHFKEP